MSIQDRTRGDSARRDVEADECTTRRKGVDDAKTGAKSCVADGLRKRSREARIIFLPKMMCNDAPARSDASSDRSYLDMPPSPLLEAGEDEQAAQRKLDTEDDPHGLESAMEIHCHEQDAGQS